jgi:hypothetical protein
LKDSVRPECSKFDAGERSGGKNIRLPGGSNNQRLSREYMRAALETVEQMVDVVNAVLLETPGAIGGGNDQDID